jgi:predicted Rossmann-fold nucleotide-binding protein
VICWTQIGFHTKPVILLNVLNFYDPLRTLIRSGIKEGFIQPHNENLVVFVEGPSDTNEHEIFDWGKAAIDALDRWDGGCVQSLPYDWQKEHEVQ